MKKNQLRNIIREVIREGDSSEEVILSKILDVENSLQTILRLAVKSAETKKIKKELVLAIQATMVVRKKLNFKGKK